MNNINSINFNTFYYNGHTSDEYGIYIGGSNNDIKIPLIPSIERDTVKVNGKHGEYISNMRYEPRIISFQVYCTNISQARNISVWLSNLTPADFYFVGDDVKVKAVLDSSSLDIGNIGYMQNLMTGQFELKFFCPSPFFTEVREEHLCIVKKKTSGEVVNYQNTKFNMQISDPNFVNTFITLEPAVNTATFNNNGNMPCYPLIKINVRTLGDVIMAINGKTMAFDNVDGWIYIDMYYCNVFKDIYNLSTNKLMDYEGDFFQLNVGLNSIAITQGDIESIIINYRKQWI